MKRTAKTARVASPEASARRPASRPASRPGLVALVGVCFVAWGVLAFVAGQKSADPDNRFNRELASVRLEILRQQGDVDRLLRRNESAANALAARLAELQAASTRLDALGQRLVQLGQLNLEEFSFDQPPPVGGPLERTRSAASSVGDLQSAIASLSRRLRQQSSELDALEYLMINRQVANDRTPAGWPVRKGWISSRFGERNDPFTGERSQHLGLDFAGTRGTEVMSVASGVVIWAANRTGYGRTVEIEHGNGLVTRYAHNEEVLVAPGQHVTAGQQIATMGTSGRASAPHVHFEVLRDGGRVNPADFVKTLR